jgi:hypothetical protein
MSDKGPAVADRSPLFSLLAANAVSQIGNMVTNVSVP